jgi:hypothetical protein
VTFARVHPPAADDDLGAAADVLAGLLTPPATGQPAGSDLRCWPMVLPSHRELIAAHCLPHLADDAAAASARHRDGILLGLAKAGGPFGPAMALALARGLASAHAAQRDEAVRAILHLVASDGLDAALLARELRLLLTREGRRPADAAASLSRIGHAGAWHLVWATSYAMLPFLLRAGSPAPGLTDLLVVAADAAAATGAPADLPAVAANADATGARA